MRLRKLLMLGAVAALMITGIASFGTGLMVPAKAWLSVRLINHAWAETLDGKTEARPWPWMDSHPVAKLVIPGVRKEHIIMSGVSGAVLAFAPGWHDGTALPGDPGISLISAHKDTHFNYLNTLNVGDVLELYTPEGFPRTYTVEDMRVVDSPEIKVRNSENESILVLSTCYPFSNWQVGGKMRFVVIAREKPQSWASL